MSKNMPNAKSYIDNVLSLYCSKFNRLPIYEYAVNFFYKKHLDLSQTEIKLHVCRVYKERKDLPYACDPYEEEEIWINFSEWKNIH